MTNNVQFIFKKGLQYRIEKLAFCRPFLSKCKGCSCPIYLSPVVQVNTRKFIVMEYKAIDSHDNQHHCFAYKLEGISPPEESKDTSKEEKPK